MGTIAIKMALTKEHLCVGVSIRCEGQRSFRDGENMRIELFSINVVVLKRHGNAAVINSQVGQTEVT